MCWNLPRPLLEIAAGRWDKLETLQKIVTDGNSLHILVAAVL